MIKQLREFLGFLTIRFLRAYNLPVHLMNLLQVASHTVQDLSNLLDHTNLFIKNKIKNTNSHLPGIKIYEKSHSRCSHTQRKKKRVIVPLLMKCS